MERHPRAGPGAARLVNPDGSLQHLPHLLHLLDDPPAPHVLGGSFRQPRHPRAPDADYDHAAPRGVDWVAGACMMVRRRALEEVGPMDERYFMYFEDVDWCARMHRRGWQVWYVPEAERVHGYRRASAAGFGRMARTHAGSLIRFWEKYSALLYLARRHRRTIRAGLLMLADLAAMNAAFLLAYSFRQEMATVLAKPLFPLGDYVTFLALTNVVGIGAFAWSGLYREENRGDWIDTLFGAGRALLLTCVLLLATTFILDARYSRVIILGFWPLALLLVTLERRLIYNGLERARRERLNVQRMALIGADPRLDDLARALREDPRHGYEPVRRRPREAANSSMAAGRADHGRGGGGEASDLRRRTRRAPAPPSRQGARAPHRRPARRRPARPPAEPTGRSAHRDIRMSRGGHRAGDTGRGRGPQGGAAVACSRWGGTAAPDHVPSRHSWRLGCC
jgi:hypothetical protein